MESRRLKYFQLCWSFQMVKINEYWRSIFFVSCCKTLLTSKTVSHYLLICFAGATKWWTFWPLQMSWKWISEAFLFCVGSLLHYFRFRIREQTFQPDLGPVRPLRIPHLVAHLLINTNLLAFYASVFIRKTFWIPLCRAVRAQKLIHDRDVYAFQPATVLPTISSFLCLKLCCVSYYVF